MRQLLEHLPAPAHEAFAEQQIARQVSDERELGRRRQVSARRARVAEELPAAHSYRLVRLEALEDQYRAGYDFTSAQRTLVLLADQLAVRLPSGTETLRGLARSQTEPGALADVLGAALITEPADRQLLLETLDVAARVEQVTGQLGVLVARFADHQGPAN